MRPAGFSSRQFGAQTVSPDSKLNEPQPTRGGNIIAIPYNQVPVNVLIILWRSQVSRSAKAISSSMSSSLSLRWILRIHSANVTTVDMHPTHDRKPTIWQKNETVPQLRSKKVLILVSENVRAQLCAQSLRSTWPAVEEWKVLIGSPEISDFRLNCACIPDKYVG